MSEDEYDDVDGKMADERSRNKALPTKLPSRGTDEGGQELTSSGNFASLCWLMTHVTKVALCELFDSVHPPARLDKTLSHPAVTGLLKQLREKSILDDAAWEMLYPKNGLTLVQSNDFDLSLLLILLRTICHLAAPYPNGWLSAPLGSDHSLAADLVRVEQLRQQVQYRQSEILADTSADSAIFRQLWTSATEVVSRLGGQKTRATLRQGDSVSRDSRRKSVDVFQQWCSKANRVGSLSTQLTHFVPVNDQGHSFQATKVKPSQFSQRQNSQAIHMSKEEIDKLEKDILRSHRKLLCDTVQSEDIVTRLVQRGVLSHEDKNRVCLSRKNGERMALLLDIVEKKAGKSFTVFCDVLKFGYKSIHDQMVAARHAPLLLLQQDPAILMEKALRQRYSDLMSSYRPWKWLLPDLDESADSLYVAPHITSEYGRVFSADHVFSQHERCFSPKRVLIRGASGSGKTELCRYVLRSWLTGTWPAKDPPVKLLLYIDLSITEPGARLVDEVRRQCLPPTYQARDADIEFMLGECGDQVLLVIDGYKQTSVTSEFDDVIRGSSFLADDGYRLLVSASTDADIAPAVMKRFDTKLLLHGLLPPRRDALVQLYANVVNAPQEFLTTLETGCLRGDGGSDDEEAGPLTLNPFLCLCLCSVVHASLTSSSSHPTVSVATDILNNFVSTTVRKRVTALMTDAEAINDAIGAETGKMQAAAYSMVLGGIRAMRAEGVGGRKGADAAGQQQRAVILLDECALAKGSFLTFPTISLQTHLAARHVLAVTDEQVKKEYVTQLLDQCQGHHTLFVSLVSQCKQPNLLDTIFHHYLQHCQRSINKDKSGGKNINFTNGHEQHSNNNNDGNHDNKNSSLSNGQNTKRGQGRGKRVLVAMSPCLELLSVTSQWPEYVHVIGAEFKGRLEVKSKDVQNPAVLAGLGLCLASEQCQVTQLSVTLDFLGAFHSHAMYQLAKGVAASQSISSLTLNFTSPALLARFLAVSFSGPSSPIRNLCMVDGNPTPCVDNADSTVWADILKVAAKTTRVEKVGIFNCRNPTIVCCLVDLLPADVRDVYLVGCLLNVQASRHVGHLVEKCASLCALSLSGCKFEAQVDIGHVVIGLKLSPTLRTLDISRTELETGALMRLAEALEFGKSLRQLNISHLTLPAVVCQKFMDALRTNNGDLQQIVVNKCRMSLTDYNRLSDVLAGKIQFVGIPNFS